MEDKEEIILIKLIIIKAKPERVSSYTLAYEDFAEI